MTSAADSGAGAATNARVPGCGTGPGRRVAFVAQELADLRREVRRHARSASDPDIDKDIEKDTDA